ncbi:hypothetical protein, partial [Paenibacillus sp.]|uniref:hypothetical protein n=1 Tax=Paenibacillus sp. TaxID=58172 RepID=UPI002D641035
NQDWNGRSAYFTPFEYAAMASANYDGHQGAMGSSVGLKNADPNAKMVMGGLAGINVEYMRGIKLWADLYRDGDVPFDVINVHHYSRNSAGTSGISPEADGLKDRLEEMVEFRNRYMPGKEIWISEFGYDTNQGSVQKAPAIGSFSGEEVQGQWLVRSYLAIAAAGVDRAQMYMMRDVDGGYGLYASSGLTSSMATGWIPKRSWYYVYTMRNVLGETKFLGEQASGNANVMIYKFKNANDDSGVYAVWAPTSNQTSVNGYTLTLAGNPTAATLVEMAAGDTDGVSTALSINNNTVIVNVSERPVFIEVDDIE